MAHLSHAWIVVSSAQEERELQAAALAAAIVCRQQNGASCGQCRDCRKALAGIHPDIIRIERETGEDGKPRRELYVNQIRALCVDAYVLPNEAARKVYIIPEADKMNEAAQNALLKLLEEPPAYAAFILCTGNPDGLLPTVRSRCAVRQYAGQLAAFSDETEAGAQQLLQAVAAGSRSELFACCMELAGCTTQQALELVECAGCRCAQMLCAQRDAMGLPAERLAALHRLLLQSADRLHVNANVKQLFGMVAVIALK